MRSIRGSALVLAVVSAFALVASACGGSSSGSGTVNATEKDFDISLSPDSVKGGKVTFEVTNSGPSTHEFVVFKTDLAPDKLPTNQAGTEVDEEGAGVTHVDEVEDVASGSNETLTVTLQAGKYVIICNLPGHYKLGMHTPLTVS